MTKTPPVTTNRQTITLTKFIQTTANTRPSVSAPAVRNAMTSAPSKDQVQLKDLLKNNSLNELMKLKPPANIAQPVATAASKSVFSSVSWPLLVRCVSAFLRVSLGLETTECEGHTCMTVQLQYLYNSKEGEIQKP